MRTQLALLFPSLFLIVLLTAAIPTSRPDERPQVYSGVNPGLSCFIRNPYLGPDAPIYYERTRDAFDEAATLARATKHPNFQRSSAYSNYFRPEDYPIVQRVYQSIIDIITDKTSNYSIRYICGSDHGPGCSKTAQDHHLTGYEFLAATSSRPDGTITFCNAFFNPRSYFYLPSLSDKPFDNSSSGWCQLHKDLDFFMSSGELVLHELTHTYEVSQRMAQLPPKQYVSCAKIPYFPHRRNIHNPSYV